MHSFLHACTFSYVLISVQTLSFELKLHTEVKQGWACSALGWDHFSLFFFFLFFLFYFIFFFLFFFFISRLCKITYCFQLVSVCPLPNIPNVIEKTAGPIGIKFGVSGRWFLNNGMLNCCNITFLINYYNCLGGTLTLQTMLCKTLTL